MATPKEIIWEIDPHTEAKHKILENYLKAWFPILSSFDYGVNYIDGFAGPGEYKNGEKGSPVVALEVALNHTAEFKKGIKFIFIEQDQKRAENLSKKINELDLPKDFATSVVCGEFDKVINEILDNLEEKNRLISPTFLFIDPFGFSGIPMTTIQRLLSYNMVEVFINFSVDSINRFIGTEEAGEHIYELFGSKDSVDIIFKNSIVDLRDHYQIILEQSAKYVRYFEMRNRQNKPVYYLFFATNNHYGHLKMKEAMWKVDPEGDFKFSDRTDPDQIVLLEKNNDDILCEELQSKFHSETVTVKTIEEYVFDKTAFIRKHMTAALKLAEVKEIIEVKEFKTDGKKRRKNTFPNNAVVIFK
jgi:three-Cys-motif partner protein